MKTTEDDMGATEELLAELAGEDNAEDADMRGAVASGEPFRSGGRPPTVEVPMSEVQRRIAESREALKHPLPAGQIFFEAPDGYIIIGEADRPHVPYRKLDGSVQQINPRR